MIFGISEASYCEDVHRICVGEASCKNELTLKLLFGDLFLALGRSASKIRMPENAITVFSSAVAISVNWATGTFRVSTPC